VSEPVGGTRRASSRRQNALVFVPLAAALVAALLVSAVMVVLSLQQPEPAPVARPTPAVSPSPIPTPTPPPGPCAEQADRPFAPKRITIPGIIRNAKVLALPRDGNNVPSVPPVGAKQVIAWDRPPGIRPGEPKGNVLLNAHTWPDGSALGNEMLSEMKVGKKIIVRNGDVELCYEVDKKVEVLAAGGFPEYYDTEGPHQLAFLVCSGRRLGPGNWTHRTIWFAKLAES
jgi:hypothetical protein